MGEEIYAGPLGETRTISTAGGGTALSTSAVWVTLIPGTNWLEVMPRNFSTAAVTKLALNPYLVVIKTTDALATVANMTDASEAVQDAGLLGTTTLDMGSFPVVATGRLYVGAHTQFRGVRVTIGNNNTTGGTVLTVKYWKTDNTWASISVTDGTSSTDTLRQTGNATWTVPTDWKKASLFDIGDTTLAAPSILKQPLFWTRWETDVAFTDASVTIAEMQAMNRDTAQYHERIAGSSFEADVHRNIGGIGCVELLTDAGTANVIVNVAARGSGGRFGP